MFSGPSIERLEGKVSVEPDRSAIGTAPRQSYGPWFESVIADDQGVLWAYYHAEFGAENGFHPRIGAQVSYDSGSTWWDLGVIIDTPAGTDPVESQLGFGFAAGGNGDFSAILDHRREYLYFVFSQYGAPPDVQGVAIARMRWADRANPVGNVWKKHGASWDEPGLRGHTTPLLANLGDAHGVRAPIDFWWGPSVHWNHHLECYVILLNRSTSGQFTADGPANWVVFATDLTDGSTWTPPVPIEFPNDYKGGWYPVAIGTGRYETESSVGRRARLFVEGVSGWRAIFLRPGEELQHADLPTLPEIAIRAGDGSDHIAVRTGDSVTITSVAGDLDGDMLQHWLELRAPSGQWSWEGWLTTAPWDNLPGGDGHHSVKSTSYAFTTPGDYVVRASVVDLNSQWVTSREIHITVSDTGGPDWPPQPPSFPDNPPPPPPSDPEEPPSDPGGEDWPVLPVATLTIDGLRGEDWAYMGDALNFSTVATDINGDLAEHWLELRAPDGSWSWEGWLTSEPWLGSLQGSGHYSAKSGALNFSMEGTYLVRASVVDSQGVWVTSPELSFTVFAP